MKTQLFVAVLGLLAGCGVQMPVNEVRGTVRGVALTPADSVFAVTALNGTPVLYLHMSNQPDACQRLKDSIRAKGSTRLTANLLAQGGGTLTTGAYNLAAQSDGRRVISAAFDQLDQTCNSAIGGPAEAASGTFNLMSFEAKEGGIATGTFDLSFGSDRISGGFRATYCDLSNASGTYTCQ